MKRLSTISRLLKLCLRFIGMWPGSAYANLCFLLYMTTIAISQYFQYTYVFTHFDPSNVSVTMECLGLTLAYSLAFIKFSILWWNRRILHSILEAMERDCRECSINDSYVSTMLNTANLSHLCSKVMIGSNALNAFFLSIGGYLLHSINGDNRADNSSRKLPIKMELPFEVSESPVFECFLIEQFLYEVVLASLVGMVNALLVSLILHVSGQIDIMRQDLIEISSNYSPSTTLNVIKSFIYRHQKTIILSENIENLFTYIALMQLLSNTLVMCCLGFMIIIIIDTNESASALIKSVSFCVSISLEVFILCFAGEFLSAKNKSISDAVYETLWYDMQPSDTRILLFVILRSQKQLTITAGKVLDLNLEGFTSIMKVSASYVSVLNAMY